MSRTFKHSLIVAVGLAILVASAIPATAKSAPVTKMRFKLDRHHFVAGEAVEASVMVMNRSEHHWVGFLGASVSVRVDGTEVATAVTDETGVATFSWVAVEGDHVMKVFYAGDESHKKAQRAQGLTVGPAPVPVPEPIPDPVV